MNLTNKNPNRTKVQGIFKVPTGNESQQSCELLDPVATNKSLSVAILSYNCEKTLGDAVNAVMDAIGKKFKDYEIIISDGGSSDRSIAIARKLINKNCY